MRLRFMLPVMGVLLFVMTLPVRAEVYTEQQEQIGNATNVLRGVLARTDEAIPKEVLDRAHGVAVIPGVLKAALLAGGRYGDGVLVVRTDQDSWSSPAFISLTGGSLGAQAGVEVSDLILVFNTQRGVDALKDGKLNLGADIGLAVGPLAGKGEWKGDVTPNVDVYGYSRNERGLFAGVSLTGSVVQFDDSANARFYGKAGITPEMIFARGPLTAPMAKNEFTCLVAKATGAAPTC